MGLRGWRLFGVAGTISVYVAGILFLSLMNMPGPHPKKSRLGRFGEMNSIHSPELSGLSRRQPIQWCKELSFINVASPKIKEIKYYSKAKRIRAKKRVEHKNNNSSINEIKDKSNLSSNMSTVRAAPIEDETSVGLIALASFPGSGNTWLRYLLQQATGILTGSIYKDYGLLKSGFPAENVCNKSVLVVKTHEWGPNAWTKFIKAILLVRDPEKAILAEFNRQSGGHVGFASPDRYKRTRGRYWHQFVTNKLNGWENMNLAWARNFTGTLKIIYYDDLVANVEEKLREVLNFLNFNIDERLLACALARKEGIYRRKKRVLTFDPYSPAMHQEIEERKIKVFKLLGRVI